jgi:hypothetical protein
MYVRMYMFDITHHLPLVSSAGRGDKLSSGLCSTSVQGLEKVKRTETIFIFIKQQKIWNLLNVMLHACSSFSTMYILFSKTRRIEFCFGGFVSASSQFLAVCHTRHTHIHTHSDKIWLRIYLSKCINETIDFRKSVHRMSQCHTILTRLLLSKCRKNDIIYTYIHIYLTGKKKCKQMAWLDRVRG